MTSGKAFSEVGEALCWAKAGFEGWASITTPPVLCQTQRLLILSVNPEARDCRIFRMAMKVDNKFIDIFLCIPTLN